MIETFLKILSNKRVSQDTFLLRLLSPEIAACAVPGQFLMVRINDGLDPVLRRPFSICGVEEEGIVRILFKVVGRGTRFLSNKVSGESLSVLGPLGKGFENTGKSKNIFFVSGGIGIAPLLFLYQSTVEKSDITFLTGFRSSGEIIDPVLTGENINTVIATDDGSMGYNGRITSLLSDRIKHGVSSDIYLYACGPLPMLKGLREICLRHKIACQVSMETIMACGLGACQGCVIQSDISKADRPYVHVCKEGPVFDIDDIDWNNI